MVNTYDSGSGELKSGVNYDLRNATRHICSHDTEGKSYFQQSPELLYTEASGAGAVSRMFSVEKLPAILEDDKDVKAYLSDDKQNVSSQMNTALTIPGGANLLCVNFAPGGVSQMHRTVSVDFSICVDGEIIMELDNGDERRLHPGVSSASTFLVMKHSSFFELSNQPPLIARAP